MITRMFLWLISAGIFGFISSPGSSAQWVLSHAGWSSGLIIHGKNVFAIALPANLYQSTDNGDHWVPLSSSSLLVGSYCMTFNDSILYVGTTSVTYVDSTGEREVPPHVYASSDLGDTWVAVGDSFPIPSHASCLKYTGNRLFAGTLGVYVIDDTGKNWIPTSLPISLFYGFAVLGDKFFATGDSGVFVSEDTGKTWSRVFSKWIMSVATVGGNIYVGGDDIYLSQDTGKTWTGLGLGFELPTAIATSEQNIFVSSQGGGIFHTSDGGNHWVRENLGLNGDDKVVFDLAIAGDNLIMAGVSGIWYRPLSEMITNVRPSGTKRLPTSYALNQNFPNPFNPSTTIKYTLPHAIHVTLKIYDILGRVVAEPVNGMQEAGYKSVEFDAGDLPSGIYFYRLTAGTFTDIKKMILLK